MPNIYTQEIPKFSKLNHKHFCAIAYASKDIANFCRHFFFLMMNRYNVVVCETPITTVIHVLTGWEKDSIKKAINRLASDGEIELLGRKSLRINDLIANKLPYVKNHNGYTGSQPSYSDKQLKVIEDLERIIPSYPNIDRKDYDMKQLLQKMEVLEEQNEKIMKAVEFLLSKAKGEDIDEVKKLYLVKNID